MNIYLNNRIKRRFKFLYKRLLRFAKPTYRSTILGQEYGIDVIYIINLDRQPQRWKKIRKELERQKAYAQTTFECFSQRLSAIDGQNLTWDETLDKAITPNYNIKDQYYVDPDPRLLVGIRDQEIIIEMSKAEIAVALSHINAWREIVATQRKYALIIEDDVFFEDDFSNSLDTIWQELPKNSIGVPIFDILYLSHKEVERGADKLEFSASLMKPVRGLWWLSGYVVSFEGAKKLLSMLPIVGPVDLWINHQFSKLNVFMSRKSIIYQRDDLKSNNEYSILPVLSRIGIQSDKTHEQLQLSKGRNPLFIITENPQCGDKFFTILSILGYRCCVDRWNLLSEQIDHSLENNNPLLFDAYIGIECLQGKHEIILQMYPEAVFILVYENERVEYLSLLQYFKDKKGKLIILKDTELNNWKTITNFLNCTIPNFPFPIGNTNIPRYETASQHVILPSSSSITYLQHDVTPWIIPLERLNAFGINKFNEVSRPYGCFTSILKDDFYILDTKNWKLLETTFPSNLASFSSKNFCLSQPSGFTLSLDNTKTKDRDYTSASIESCNATKYGRFEIVMKAVKSDGVITAFFLHRNDPWQEIDIEFLGKDTTKMLINVYYNPGDENAGSNYGNRGTPVLVDLGFDASIDYHKYSIEWEPHEIRWFVDNKLVHVRGMWEPTPIPDLPMNIFVNFWPSQSEELAGSFSGVNLPKRAEIKSIEIYSWVSS